MRWPYPTGKRTERHKEGPRAGYDALAHSKKIVFLPFQAIMKRLYRANRHFVTSTAFLACFFLTYSFSALIKISIDL